MPLAGPTRRCLTYNLILAIFANVMRMLVNFYEFTVRAEFRKFSLQRDLRVVLHGNAVATILFTLQVEIVLAVNAL